MSILFHATEKTQKPFLKNLIERKNTYHNKNISKEENLEIYIKKTYENIFNNTNPKKETLDLIKKVLEKINNPRPILEKFKWFNGKEGGSFVYIGDDNKIIHSNTIEKEKSIELNRILDIKSIKLKDVFSPFDELEIRARLDLISGVLSNFVQYDNINPLLSRIESISVSLKKIIDIVEEDNSNKNNLPNLEVISLKNCNQEIKKMFPILLAKEYFREHKIKTENEVKNTFHLIIDEAHNILSQQSNREAES